MARINFENEQLLSRDFSEEEVLREEVGVLLLGFGEGITTSEKHRMKSMGCLEHEHTAASTTC